MLGDQTISVESSSSHISGSSTTYSKTNRRLMTHDEVRRMGKDEAIFISGNYDPINTKVTPVYENRGMMKVLGEYEGTVANVRVGNKRVTERVDLGGG